MDYEQICKYLSRQIEKSTSAQETKLAGKISALLTNIRQKGKANWPDAIFESIESYYLINFKNPAKSKFFDFLSELVFNHKLKLTKNKELYLYLSNRLKKIDEKIHLLGIFINEKKNDYRAFVLINNGKFSLHGSLDSIVKDAKKISVALNKTGSIPSTPRSSRTSSINESDGSIHTSSCEEEFLENPEYKRLKEQLTEAIGARRMSADRAKQAQDRADALELEVTKTKKNLEAANKNFTATERTLTNSVQTLTQQLKDAQAKGEGVDALQDQITALKSEISQQRTLSSQEITTLKDKINQAQTHADALALKEKTLDDRIQILTQQLQEAQIKGARVDDLQDQLTKIKRENAPESTVIHLKNQTSAPRTAAGKTRSMSTESSFTNSQQTSSKNVKLNQNNQSEETPLMLEPSYEQPVVPNSSQSGGIPETSGHDPESLQAPSHTNCEDLIAEFLYRRQEFYQKVDRHPISAGYDIINNIDELTGITKIPFPSELNYTDEAYKQLQRGKLELLTYKELKNLCKLLELCHDLQDDPTQVPTGEITSLAKELSKKSSPAWKKLGIGLMIFAAIAITAIAIAALYPLAGTSALFVGIGLVCTKLGATTVSLSTIAYSLIGASNALGLLGFGLFLHGKAKRERSSLARHVDEFIEKTRSSEGGDPPPATSSATRISVHTSFDSDGEVELEDQPTSKLVH